MRNFIRAMVAVGVGAASLFGARSAFAIDCSVKPASGSACLNSVKSYDAYCDTNVWDSYCVSECNTDAACQGVIANDSCSASTTNVSAGGTWTGTTASATNNANHATASDCDRSDGKDVVYRMKFEESKTVNLSTEGSAFDTVLYVRKATAGNDDACGGVQVACQDDGLPGYTSSLSFTAEANQMYYVFVDGYASTNSGAYKLKVDVASTAVTVLNDTIATASDLGTVSATAPASGSGSSVNATNTYTPTCGSSVGKDVVYKFTTTATSSVTIDTEGSSFDTVLSVRNATAQLTGACDDDSGDGNKSKLTLASLPAGTYYAVVGGYSGASGSVTVNIKAATTKPVLFVNGHGVHTGDYVDYWGGTGGTAFPVWMKNNSSGKIITTHGYDHTVSLATAANNLANDINSTYPGLPNGDLTIVAHSAGGLVVRYLLSHNNDAGAKQAAALKISKLISVQAPQNGTVLANIVTEPGFLNWVGGLAGFNTPMVNDMRTYVMSGHGNCTGTTGECAKIKTIGADGADKGWMNDISKFLGIPVPGTGHWADWGLMLTGEIGRNREADFNYSDGFISKASASYVGTNLGFSNANHYHGTRCDYRTDLCTWAKDAL